MKRGPERGLPVQVPRTQNRIGDEDAYKAAKMMCKSRARKAESVSQLRGAEYPGGPLPLQGLESGDIRNQAGPQAEGFVLNVRAAYIRAFL